jgi:hypothetical protein
MTEPKSEHLVRREHYVTGRQDERERIVALLEGDIAICKEFGHQDNDADCDAGCDAVRHCIALIKGEIE